VCYLLHAGFLLGLFFILEGGIEMSLGKLVDFTGTERRYIPEDRTPHDHGYGNLKPYELLLDTDRTTTLQ
jgi:hypothetical protein